MKSIAFGEWNKQAGNLYSEWRDTRLAIATGNLEVSNPELYRNLWNLIDYKVWAVVSGGFVELIRTDCGLLSLTHSWVDGVEYIGEFKVWESDGNRWAVAPLPDGRFLCWGKNQDNVIFDSMKHALNHCI